MADHSIHVRGAPLKASQRKFGRDRARGRGPVTATPAIGAISRYRGRAGVVTRVDGTPPTHVVVDFDGRLWWVPLDELEWA
jgi:hypothetical protein